MGGLPILNAKNRQKVQNYRMRSERDELKRSQQERGSSPQPSTSTQPDGSRKLRYSHLIPEVLLSPEFTHLLYLAVLLILMIRTQNAFASESERAALLMFTSRD